MSDARAVAIIDKFYSKKEEEVVRQAYTGEIEILAKVNNNTIARLFRIDPPHDVVIDWNVSLDSPVQTYGVTTLDDYIAMLKVIDEYVLDKQHEL